MPESVQKVDAVLVVFENGLFFIAARGDVIHPVRDHIAVKRIDKTRCLNA
jgi:hypothetical protein